MILFSGTGKTDVAVQIISNLYHNHPNQRTLIVTHSNQALNQLFEKIMALDIDERHLLRLGHGEEALETEKDFSRYGRVNYVLAKRIDLLDQVQKLQESLGVTGDVSYTCETAGYFYLYQVISRWEKFVSEIENHNGENYTPTVFSEQFPFTRFFNDAPQPLFPGQNYKDDLNVAKGCFEYISKIFTQLEEFRAFELLRSGLDRSKYLLVKEARIIAMTCTHAALKRKELVNMGFKYDNILMEESAQILEIETFIPLLLQNPLDGHNRLKRWIMIGDNLIKIIFFYSNLNLYSLFFIQVIIISCRRLLRISLSKNIQISNSHCSVAWFVSVYLPLIWIAKVVHDLAFQLYTNGVIRNLTICNMYSIRLSTICQILVSSSTTN